MKKPFISALVAVIYIVVVVFVMNGITSILPNKTILIPIAILGLFVLSTAVMGYLFLSEPFNLYMEYRRQEAINYFVKVSVIFAIFVIVFLIFLFLR